MGISISEIRATGMLKRCMSRPRIAFSDEAISTFLPASMASVTMVSVQYGMVRSMQSLSDSERGSLRCTTSLPASSERISVSLDEMRTWLGLGLGLGLGLRLG